MELLLGGDFDNFESEAHKRSAWFAHRESLLAAVNLCSRPQAFWDFEHPGEQRPGEFDHDTLERLRLLTETETAYLAAQRKEKSCEPNRENFDGDISPR